MITIHPSLGEIGVLNCGGGESTGSGHSDSERRPEAPARDPTEASLCRVLRAPRRGATISARSATSSVLAGGSERRSVPATKSRASTRSRFSLLGSVHDARSHIQLAVVINGWLSSTLSRWCRASLETAALPRYQRSSQIDDTRIERRRPDRGHFVRARGCLSLFSCSVQRQQHAVCLMVGLKGVWQIVRRAQVSREHWLISLCCYCTASIAFVLVSCL